MVVNIRARLGLSRDAWRSDKQIFESAVSNVIVRAGETPEGQLGGVGIVVEVDECHVHSRKFNRGNPLASEKLWVVGVMERTPNADGGRKAAFFVAVKRDAGTLLPFIRRWVAPGSILISDEWKGYTRELEEAYFPAKVNHSVRYAQWGVVDGVEMSINTNHIEGNAGKAAMSLSLSMRPRILKSSTRKT